MPVDNVNTYAIARSHLRCPKNRTENRRQIYRTASGANVNWGINGKEIEGHDSAYIIELKNKGSTQKKNKSWR